MTEQNEERGVNRELLQRPLLTHQEVPGMSRSEKQSSLFLLSILVPTLLLLGVGNVVALADDPCTDCAGTYNAWVQADAEYHQMQDSTTYQNYVAAVTKYIYCLNQGCFTGGDPDSEADPDPCLRGLQTCQWIWGGNERCLEKCVERYLACSAAYAEYSILDAGYKECLDCLTRCDVPEAIYPGTKEEYAAFKARCDAEYQSLCEGDPQHLLERVIAARNRYMTLSSDTTCTASETAVLDSDGDGVPDDVDVCPGTSLGAVVDATGCPQQLQLGVLPINEIHDPGDAVTVQGTVTDAKGNAIPGVALDIEIESTSLSASAGTMYDVTHYSSQLSLPQNLPEGTYTVRVTASKAGYSPVSETTSLRVGQLLSIEVEGDYTGVAADGVSELRFIVEYPEEATNPQFDCTSDEMGILFERIVVLSPCKLVSDQPGRMEITFKPRREEITEPYKLRIDVTVDLPNGQHLANHREVQVVRPPVVFIHGIWASRTAMVPMRRSLINSGEYPASHTLNVDYGTPPGKSTQDIRHSAKVLADGVDRLLEELEREGIKASRVDIVAHSMGGVIARYYILKGYMDARGQVVGPGQAAKVRKLITLDTPHAGSHVADWYVDFMRTRYVVCGTDPNLFDPQCVTDNELEWFLDYIRSMAQLPRDGLAFGEAVRQLQTAGRPGSIVDELRRGQSSANVRYYLIAGDEPLLEWWKSWFFVPVVMDSYPYHQQAYVSSVNPMGFYGPCSEFVGEDRRVVRDVVSEFRDMVGEEGTDGVVPLSSQLDAAIPAEARLAVHANHLNVTLNGPVHYMMMSYLTDDRMAIDLGTIVMSKSPGHLHVYDEEGRHVGIGLDGQPDIGISGADYASFSDMTGEHEYIRVPGTAGIRVEFLANAEGTVGLDISQGLAEGLHWFGYENIAVAPGSEVSIHLHPTAPTGQVVHSDGTTSILVPTYSEIPEGGGENHSPTASFALMPREPEAGDDVVVASTSSGSDGDLLTLSWYLNGEQLSEIGNQSDWEWENVEAGKHTLLLRVEDGKGGTDEYSTVVDVRAPGQESDNRPPTASFALMPTDPKAGDPIVIVSTSSDPDGDPLMHTWYVNGEYEISAGDLPEWTWSSPGEGEYTIGLVVMDGEGGAGEYSETVTVAGAGDEEEDARSGSGGASNLLYLLLIPVAAAAAILVARRHRRR